MCVRQVNIVKLSRLCTNSRADRYYRFERVATEGGVTTDTFVTNSMGVPVSRNLYSDVSIVIE